MWYRVDVVVHVGVNLNLFIVIITFFIVVTVEEQVLWSMLSILTNHHLGFFVLTQIK